MKFKVLIALAIFASPVQLNAQQTGVWIQSSGYFTTPAGNTYHYICKRYNADGSVTYMRDDGWVFTPAVEPRTMPGE